jgi:hypothetical protein
VRGLSGDLVTPNTTMSAWSGTASGATEVKPTTIAGDFSLVPPVLVDTGSVAQDGTRYWALALTEKAADRQLWALPFDAAGAEKSPVAWLDSASGVGATVLGGTSAVCGLDAAYDAGSGEVVATVVVRQGGDDVVYLVRFGDAGATAPVVVAQKASAGDCRQGLAAARVSVGQGELLVSVYDAIAALPTLGSAGLYSVTGSSVQSVSIPSPVDASTTDSAAAGGPTNNLAARGLSAPLVAGDAVGFVHEGTSAGGKQVITWSSVPATTSP